MVGGRPRAVRGRRQRHQSGAGTQGFRLGALGGLGGSVDAAFASTLRREITAADPSIGIHAINTLESLVSDSAAQPKFRTVALVSMAVLAILLAAVGLYSVVAYSVAQRTPEIGIRMALGAGRGDVMRLVLREGTWLAGGGVAIGMLAARVFTRAVASLLYGVQPTDVASFVAAGLVLMMVAMTASYLPARRASRIDPLAALRTE